MKKLSFAAVAALLLITAGSCNKEETGSSRMTVKMTDAPGDFQQVNVDVIEVKVHHSVDGWVSLPTAAGIYDLLTLQDSVTTVLVNQGQLPAGHIDQFRLVLGPNNTVMVDSLIYPLATPSAQQSGLKINVNFDFAPNETYELLMDFDAGQSIIQHGNGDYSLKPVINLGGIIEL
jgi:hypothetical protein